MPKVIDAKSWQLTPASDGRRYSKYPNGDAGFNVSVSSLANPNPGYRIYNPGTALWSEWYAGGTEGGTGTVTNVQGSLLAGPFAFTDATVANTNTLTESNEVTITSEGHRLQVRRNSGFEEGVPRYLDVFIGAQTTQWAITVTEATPPSPPPSGEVSPAPTVIDGAIYTGDTVTIGLSDSSYNGSSLPAGSVITLAAGNHVPIVIDNLQGTAAKPILIRNDPAGSGPAVFRRTSIGSGGFVINFRDCHHVIVDGLFKWVGAPSSLTYGIQSVCTVAGDGPSAMWKIGRYTSYMTFRGCYANPDVPAVGASGIGFSTGDNNVLWGDSNNTYWHTGYIFEFCKAEKTGGEAFYVGSNWFNPPRVPSRDVIVRYCVCDNNGKNGINIKTTLAGTNLVYKNVSGATGLGYPASNTFGTSTSILDCGGYWEIFDNYLADSGQAGIRVRGSLAPKSQWPTSTVKIFNNVVVNSGAMNTPGPGDGILVNSSSTAVQYTPEIYNNTVITTVDDGIRVSNTISPVIRDNIVCAAGGTAISGITGTNNRVGTIASQDFVNEGARNFRLTSDSLAKDSGSVSGFPPFDFDGVSRPQGAAADQGAFEFEVV